LVVETFGPQPLAPVETQCRCLSNYSICWKLLTKLCAPETIFLSHCSLQGRCHLFRRPAGKAGCWLGDSYFGVIPTPVPPFFLWLWTLCWLGGTHGAFIHHQQVVRKSHKLYK
uniref:Uncharacterized protein n=1 Tax=Anas zonorhyncha TaxID=75864 RepID=A0A8B9UXM9_9AVES